jgi:hypothetical protein
VTITCAYCRLALDECHCDLDPGVRASRAAFVEGLAQMALAPVEAAALVLIGTWDLDAADPPSMTRWQRDLDEERMGRP